MVVIGGIGTIRGPIFGAILIGALPEILRFAKDYRLLIYCLLLIIMVRFQPQGLLGEDSVLHKLWKRITGRKPSAPAAPEGAGQTGKEAVNG